MTTDNTTQYDAPDTKTEIISRINRIKSRAATTGKDTFIDLLSELKGYNSTDPEIQALIYQTYADILFKEAITSDAPDEVMVQGLELVKEKPDPISPLETAKALMAKIFKETANFFQELGVRFEETSEENVLSDSGVSEKRLVTKEKTFEEACKDLNFHKKIESGNLKIKFDATPDQIQNVSSQGGFQKTAMVARAAAAFKQSIGNSLEGKKILSQFYNLETAQAIVQAKCHQKVLESMEKPSAPSASSSNPHQAVIAMLGRAKSNAKESTTPTYPEARSSVVTTTASTICAVAQAQAVQRRPSPNPTTTSSALTSLTTITGRGSQTQ